MIGKIIDIMGENDPDAPTIVKITPGVNPYLQLNREEEELEYKVEEKLASEVHPDDDEADNLSCITVDSLKYIDNEKVKNIWKGMAKLKQQEGEYYSDLAEMVDKMTLDMIYKTVQATPRLSTALPQCAEDLLTELESEELFRRILAIRYMSWQAFEKNRKKRLGETYKPNTVWEVAARFNISTSRLMDLRRGAAINREDMQRVKMMKAKKKEQEEGKTPVGSREATPEDPTVQPSTSTQE